jgi:hypothetical protein
MTSKPNPAPVAGILKRAKPAGLSRDVATIKRLLKDCGDMLVSDLLELLQDDLKRRKPGRPPEWDDHMHRIIYIDVEAVKRMGVGQRLACRTVAYWHELTRPVVEDRHKKGKPLFEQMTAQEKSELQEAHASRISRFIKECGILTKDAQPAIWNGAPPIKKLRPDERHRLTLAFSKWRRTNKILDSK